ncbi:MAG: amino acid ABC transporter permease [Acidocella sp.]|uniref:amino acid ABC transporter permease n=1 Tax=Acidocella sp. TaxID=50710 RepID=UPI003FD7B2C3
MNKNGLSPAAQINVARWARAGVAPASSRAAVLWGLFAVAVAAATLAGGLWSAVYIRRELISINYVSAPVTLGLLGVASLSLALGWPVARSLLAARAAIRSAADISALRAHVLESKNWALCTAGYALAAGLVFLFALFIAVNHFAVGETFFDLGLIRDTAPLVLTAFQYNIEIFLSAEVLILVWGLLIALARMAPGPAGLPVRTMATIYCDLFRALPTIVAVYLIAFGLPLTGLALFSNLSPIWLAVLALTLSYGAYEAEIYRAGISSIHWSQAAGARSLGLSYLQTLRFVVVPQALKRIVPPLLNDFISLQKDTALVSVVGTVEAFNQAKIIASNHFNLSAVTTVALLFIVITIPQARLVDRLIARDQRRTQAGG